MTASTAPVADGAIAILAGGASRRMGRDKALLEWDGMTLLHRTAALALGTGLPVLVVGRDAPAGWALPAVSFIPDDVPGQGPLGGLVAALTRRAPVIALACDMPLLEARALAWLTAEVRAQRAAGALGAGLAVRQAAGLEPLFACYAEPCLPTARAHLAAGRRALHALIEEAAFTVREAPAWLVPMLANVNRPEEWAGIARRGTP